LGGSPIKVLILLDMVGSPGVTLTPDLHSHPGLLKLARSLDDATNKPPLFGTLGRPVEDDHIPFREHGIPAINLIDFEHLDTWHQPGDDPDRVSIASIVKVSRLALALSLGLLEFEIPDKK